MLASRFSKIFGAVALSLTPFAITLVPASSVAQAADASNTSGAITFDIKVADNVQVSHERWFKFGVDPGTTGKTVSSFLTIKSTINEVQEVRIAPTDTNTQVYGGVNFTSFQPDLESNLAVPGDVSAVGTWIKIQSSVVLEPNATVTVPFTIDVPTTAAAGVNLGGLSVWKPAVENDNKKTAGTNEVALPKQFVVRRAVGIEVVTPGALDPNLRVNGVSPEVSASGLELRINTSNLGTDYMKAGTGLIEVTQGGFQRTFDMGEVIPGNTFNYPVQWVGDAQAGDYDATVRINYADNRVATWTGKFTLGEEMANRAHEKVLTVDTKKDSHLFLFLILGALLALLLAGLAAWFFLGRSDDEDEDDDDDEDDDEDYEGAEFYDDTLDPDVGRAAPTGAPRFENTDESADTSK